MKNLYIDKSLIHGRGLFTAGNLNEGDIIGVSHVVYDNIWYQVVPIGLFYNHSLEPNCIVTTDNNVNLIVTNRDIDKDEELTVDYSKQLHLEQPTGDWI